MSEDDLMEWLRAGLMQPGKSQRGLAAKLKLDPSQISRMLQGERAVKWVELLIISEYIGRPPPIGISPPQGTPQVPLRAVLAGGVWREVGAASVRDTTQVSAVLHPKLVGLDQYACRVEGKDFNKRISPGKYVVCVPFRQIRSQPEDGDVVHVERRRGPLREDTLRLVRLTKKGIELWPDSDDPNFQKPLVYPSERPDETTEIVGLLVATYEFWQP